MMVVSMLAMAEGNNMPIDEEYGDMLVDEHADENKEVMDKYLNMELTMGIGMDDERQGRVVKHLRGIGGEPTGHAHSNPFFDTREYDVKFMDGTTEKYAANVIADNMYAQVDDKVTCVNSCWKSWIIRRMEWQSISWQVQFLQQMDM
jgi:hypothetical protein